ncbi:MAG TPA: PAS domain S-box protein [Candidatus Acidoferrales bacterium]|nr:PAS domain S-box protein [Candidatus Acidoferrales bacterium]
MTPTVPKAPTDHEENLQHLRARIDELERTEAELRGTVAEFRAVFDTFPDLHFRLAADGMILSFYAGNRADLYVPPETFLGKRMSEVLPADVGAQIHAAVADVLANGSSVRIEYQLPIRTVTEHFEMRVVRFAETQVIAIVRNVTAQKRAEEATRESDARFTSTFEHAPVGMALVGLDGRYVRVNRALCEMFGYTEAEFLALPVWQLTHPDDMMVTIDWLRRMVDGEVDTWHLEKRFIHRLGHTVWGLSDTSVVRGSDGRALYVISQVQDITELKRTQERLQTLSRRLLEVQEAERRHLARELHDEIGQVLTGLALTIDRVGDMVAPPARARLTDARQSLDDLIGSVRALSLDLRPSMLDDLGLVAAVKWFVERHARQTNTRVRFDHLGLDRRFAPEVEIGAYRIVQEALNNVARHPGVADAWVRLWVEDDALRVEVVDHGKGFDTDMAHATGGLHGMHERARLLGGELRVESDPGKGTRVSATLPIGADLSQL